VLFIISFGTFTFHIVNKFQQLSCLPLQNQRGKVASVGPSWPIPLTEKNTGSASISETPSGGHVPQFSPLATPLPGVDAIVGVHWQVLDHPRCRALFVLPPKQRLRRESTLSDLCPRDPEVRTTRALRMRLRSSIIAASVAMLKTNCTAGGMHPGIFQESKS